VYYVVPADVSGFNQACTETLRLKFLNVLGEVLHLQHQGPKNHYYRTEQILP